MSQSRGTTMKTNTKVGTDQEKLKARAAEANGKRKARVSKKESEARVKAYAQQAKTDSDIIMCWDEAHLMNEEFKPAKKKSSSKLGKKIKVVADGQGFASLNAALRAMEPKKWADETDYRRSCWTAINRALKKKGEAFMLDHEFTLV